MCDWTRRGKYLEETKEKEPWSHEVMQRLELESVSKSKAGPSLSIGHGAS